MSVIFMPHLQSRLPPIPLLFAIISLAVMGPVLAAETRSTSGGMRERVLRMTDFFDTMLPGVLEEQNMTLHFRPKFGDLRDEEYMRFPIELRYGLMDRVELQGGIVPFTPSPFNRGRNHRWGPGEAKLG